MVGRICQFIKCHWLGLTVVCVISVILAIGGLYLHGAYVTVPNAYAVWNAADIVAIYMEMHDGAWPQEWDDLREAYEIRMLQPADEWFDDLQKRVVIDWDADPVQLAATEATGDDPPFRVIYLSNGSDVHWEGAEPNRIIYEYLRGDEYDYKASIASLIEESERRRGGLQE